MPYFGQQSEKLKTELLYLLSKYFKNVDFNIVLVNSFKVGSVFSYKYRLPKAMCASLVHHTYSTHESRWACWKEFQNWFYFVLHNRTSSETPFSMNVTHIRCVTIQRICSNEQVRRYNWKLVFWIIDIQPIIRAIFFTLVYQPN